MIPLIIGHPLPGMEQLLEQIEVVTSPARPILQGPGELDWTHPPGAASVVILLGLAAPQLAAVLAKLTTPGGPRRILVQSEDKTIPIQRLCALHGASGPFSLAELKDLEWSALAAASAADSRRAGEPSPRAVHQLLQRLNHFLRNRLCTLEQIFAIAAEDLPNTPQLAGTMPRIEQEVQRIEAALDRMLAMIAPLPPADRRLDLVPILRSVVEEVRFDLPRPVTFDLRIPAGLPPVRGDDALAAAAIREILNNAAAHAGREGRGGTVEVHLTPGRDATLVLRVHHDGRGISTEDREKVFRAFYTTGECNSGLGLPIAARIMSHMGGRIELLGDGQGGLDCGAIFALDPPSESRAARSSNEPGGSTR